MEIPTYLVIAITIISILWAAIGLISLFTLLDSFEVKYLNRRVTIHNSFFFPYILLILCGCWAIWG